MSERPTSLTRGRMGHRPALDGLRGVAILLVVAVHLYAPVFSGGSSGVDLFFVLSGFLITKLAYEEQQFSGRVSLSDFYLRRVFRILPALFFLLFCMLLLSFTVLHDVGSTLRLEVLFSGVSIGNLWPIFFGFRARSALGHTWSLGIEEQFYLCWPLILVMSRSAFARPRRFFVWVAFITAVSVVVGRVVVVGLLHYPHWGSIPFFDFDGLALGCLIAIYVHTDDSGTTARLPTWPAFAGAALVLTDLFAARFYSDHDTYSIRILVVRICCAVVLLIVATQPGTWLATRLANDRLAYVGRISYSLYLWHLPIFYMLSSDRAPSLSRVIRIPLELILAFAAAALSHRYIEQPALRVGRSVREAIARDRVVTLASLAEPAKPS